MHHIYSNYIAPASVLIPLIIGLSIYKKVDTAHRFLLAMLGFSALSTILARVFAYLYHNNLIIIQSYTVGEFLLLAGFYYYQFESVIMRRTIVIMMTLFTAFTIYLIIIFIRVTRFDDYAPSIESLLIFFLSLSLVYKNDKSSLKLKAWHQDPVNWFNTGIFLYFSGSLFIFLLSNYLRDPKTLIYKVIWNVQATFLLLLSLFFAIGFYKIKQEKSRVIDA